jgi:ribulose 1,5-bisphosphate carboxylase large subunit-like protein
MLVLTEEAYAWATESNPYGNVGEGVIPDTGVIELAGDDAAAGGGAMGHPVGILPSAKLILHISSVRKSMSASD